MAWDGDIRSRFPDWGTDVALARWPEVRARLTVGQAVRGEVIARAPFGVWVDIGSEHPALLLVPEMAGAGVRPIRFEDYPELGAVVEARIVSLGDRAEIRLTQNPRFDPA
jgi:ribosomal protein S1